MVEHLGLKAHSFTIRLEGSPETALGCGPSLLLRLFSFLIHGLSILVYLFLLVFYCLLQSIQ